MLSGSVLWQYRIKTNKSAVGCFEYEGKGVKKRRTHQTLLTAYTTPNSAGLRSTMETTNVVGFVYIHKPSRTQNQFAFISLKTPEIQLTFTMGLFLFFVMKMYVWMLKRISLRLPSQSLRFIDVTGFRLKRFAPSIGAPPSKLV